jgi:hypothetical protein
MDWVNLLLDRVRANDTLLWWMFAFSAAMFLLSPVLVAWVAIRLPHDYFASKQRPALGTWERQPTLRLLGIAAKNVLGAMLLMTGLAMLILPGQGLLMIVVGLMLLDFPGKSRLERWLVTRSGAWRSINWLRTRAGRRALERPK